MKRFLSVAVLFGISVAALDAAANPWRLTVGLAWRSRVKASLSGNVPVTPVQSSHTVTYDKDVVGTTSWGVGDVTTVPDTDPYAPAGSTLYAVESVRTETTITAGDASGRLNGSDDDSPLGFKMSAGYDFYDDECFTIGLDFRFAAYWNMKSDVSGAAAGGAMRVQTMKDYYLFESGPYPDDIDFSYCLPETSPHLPYRETLGDTTTTLPGSAIRAMVTSDLYQLGIGPRFGWHVCEWLDAYAGVSALCNIASIDFDVNGSGRSVTECRFGAGADLGLAAWLSENLGIYAEVGYEWIDEPTVRNGGMSAEMDYSSLIVSIGGIVRF